MAIILAFQASVAKRAARRRRPKGRPAEIVIFPGVRYERRRAPKAKPVPLKRKAIRDILQLVD